MSIKQYPGLLPTGDETCSCGTPSCSKCFALHRDGMDAFTRSYIETALWSSTDESTPSGGENMDANYSSEDIDAEAVRNIIETCASFQQDQAELLSQAYKFPDYTPARAGYDFWLTRNGHGAGFWDRGLGEVGDKLSDAAKAYGESNLFVTDRNTIQLSNFDGQSLAPSMYQQLWEAISPTLRSRLEREQAEQAHCYSKDPKALPVELTVAESTPFGTPGAFVSEDCTLSLDAHDKNGRWLASCQARFINDDDGGFTLVTEIETAAEAVESRPPRNSFKHAQIGDVTSEAKAELQDTVDGMFFSFSRFVEACQSAEVHAAAKTLDHTGSPEP